MRTPFDADLEARLCRYAAIDTQSDETSETSPSTEIQRNLLELLMAELEEIGAQDIRQTETGAVIATIPGTVEGVPPIGWLAHVDTAPAYHATGVTPRVHRGYNGGEIRFPEAPDLVLSPERSAYLASKTGHDIITASGSTLLGADDKAGVAIIMAAARHLISERPFAHGPIRIAFTPDEEIGRGVSDDLPAALDVAFAYTFDGQEVGSLEWESFSADAASISIEGVSTHTGTAKGKMVNALHLAAKIVDLLPKDRLTPEVTDGRDGFIHVYDLQGSAAVAEIKMILRDFEIEGLAAQGALIRKICDAVAATEPRAEIACQIRPQYRNMRYWLEQDMAPVELAREAYRAVGVEPLSVPIRGGTDGSLLTEKGVPTPNLFTGMQDIHGPLEWISVQDMGLATEVALKLAGLWAERQG